MAVDRYSFPLKCPACGKTGRADFREKDGGAYLADRGRHVDKVSDGFSVVDHGAAHGTETVIRCECGEFAEF